MQQFNNTYRLFFKKLTDLDGMSISSPELRVLSLKIERDLLKKTSTTLNVINVPSAVEIGDVVVMYDNFGTTLFTGVVNTIEGNSVRAGQILDIFDDTWLWNNPRLATIEETLIRILQNDFQNTNDVLLNAIFDKFDLEAISETRQKLETRENQYTTSFSTFLYDVYEKYSIQLLFDIPFEAGRPKIKIGIPHYDDIKIGNNAEIFRNFNVATNVFETNKLVVYSQETSEYRATWYTTTSGITDDSGALNRPQKINTNIIFSDDNINVLKASSLRNQIYNHEITCELVYDNKLLKFENLRLGQVVDLYYNSNYFNTILTGYSFDMNENDGIAVIKLKFGLVRTSLTSKLFKRLAV